MSRIGLRAMHLCLLRAASLAVPADLRSEWWREWRGELWHVWEAAGQDTAQVTRFCLGAFADAWCLRRERMPAITVPRQAYGSPQSCLAGLAVALVMSTLLGTWLPGVRAEHVLGARTVGSNLVTITNGATDDLDRPTIAADEFRAWVGRGQSGRQRYFDGLAFYSTRQESVLLEGDRARAAQTWNVARATGNVFAVLGLEIRPLDSHIASAAGPDELPQVVLSERAWKGGLGAETRIAGRKVRVGKVTMAIAGVVPDGSVELPGKVDAWVLSPQIAESGGVGFAIGRLNAAGAAEMWGDRVQIAGRGQDGLGQDLIGIALKTWKPSPARLYAFALLLALLALPALTSVSMGETSANRPAAAWQRRLILWGFFMVKAALLLPTMYLVAFNLAYGSAEIGREDAVYIQLGVSFVLTLFGMCWLLKDQRQRCPVCLRSVAHPAQVGQSSRTFLDWNGTEMMCMGGHTLLHVPSLPTSWFGTQRWLYLDASWSVLFVAPTEHIS